MVKVYLEPKADTPYFQHAALFTFLFVFLGPAHIVELQWGIISK